MKVYSVQEAAKEMKTSTQIIYKLISRRMLEALKVKSLKIPEYAIEEFFRKNKFKDLTDLDNIIDLE